MLNTTWIFPFYKALLKIQKCLQAGAKSKISSRHLYTQW